MSRTIWCLFLIAGILAACEQEVTLTDATVNGTHTDYFTGASIALEAGKSLTLTPWQYLIFIQ